MMYSVDYADHKLLIRNEATGESIVETKILEYNKSRHSILIDATKFVDQLAQIRLTLLIFTSNAVHVYGGMARKTFSPRQLEISMYQGKEHDDRAAKRYTANLDAVISSVILPEGEEIFNEVMNVKVLDLSTHGVQIQTDFEELVIQSRFTLMLNIADNPTRIKCVVVRCLSDEEGGHKIYGCKFLSVESV